MTTYSVKMRASSDGQHISGAERLVRSESVPTCVDSLTHRALTHPKGTPDEITVTVRAVDGAEPDPQFGMLRTAMSPRETLEDLRAVDADPAAIEAFEAGIGQSPESPSAALSEQHIENGHAHASESSTTQEAAPANEL
ncbi:hypothetical protein OS127_10795 [Corynebacterium sp. P6129]|nr:6-carboxyhexanoate--CoA ligase [Corynebacterium antarcticum]MCX7492993.1 hypothetical protein [Corynebacterium antarcticum]